MLIRTLILLLLLLALQTSLYAGNTYPYSYEVAQAHDGGKLVAIEDSANGSISSFFIKPNWAGESEVIYSWNGATRHAARGTSYGDVYIMDAVACGKFILLVWSENSRIYAVSLDTAAQVVSKVPLGAAGEAKTPGEAHWFNNNASGDILLTVGRTLYKCHIGDAGSLAVSMLSDGVANATMLGVANATMLGGANATMLGGPDDAATICFVTGLGSRFLVNFIGTGPQVRTSSFVPLSDELSLFEADGQVAVVSSKSKGNSLLQIINETRGATSALWLESRVSLIKIFNDNGSTNLAYLKVNSGKYSLVQGRLADAADPKKLTETDIPGDFIEPMELIAYDGVIYVLFRNGLVTFDYSAGQRSEDFIPFGEIFTDSPSLQVLGHYTILSSRTGSLILNQDKHPLWFLSRFYASMGRILLPLLLAVALLVLLQFYRHDKRFLRAVLNLPSSSMVLVIDKRGHLALANLPGRNLLALNPGAAMHKPFQYYCSREHTKPVREIVQKFITSRSSGSQKITIVRDGESRELLCNITPMSNLAGQFRGIVFAAVDITEELGRKQLSNWAQLAHDMQTNLSTIRLNAELLEEGINQNNLGRRNKILHQVGLLIERVRDIVTVGRGDTATRQPESAVDICNAARHEFDDTVFPNVEFHMDTSDFNLLCDRPKLVRALRNAIENAIRSLKGNPGFIKISCSNDESFAYFSIRDNGCGMDEKTRNKMLTPYFTTSKKEGGTGIGTMIMQHVAELHNGSIKLYSEKGSGTEIIFCIPYVKYSKPKRVK